MTEEEEDLQIVCQVDLLWALEGNTTQEFYEETVDTLLELEQRETERRMREGK